MRRLPVSSVALGLVALGVLLPGLLLAACSSDTGFAEPPAATVNGTDISRASVLDDLAALAGSSAVRDNLESQNLSVYGETEGSYNSQVSSQVLSSRVIDVLIEQELTRRGEVPTQDEISSATDQFSGFEDLPDAFKQRQVDSIANRAALTRLLSDQDEPADTEVTEEDVRAYYDENVESILAANPDVACVSHILVKTQDEADQVVARLAAGEDFAALATELSVDTGSGSAGGDLGCQPSSSYVAEFKQAVDTQPVGEVGPPVQTEYGFHVILVRSRGELPYDAVKGSIRQVLEQKAASGGKTGFDKWLEVAVTEADVTVDPMFGSWTPDTFPTVVTPPEGATQPVYPLASANTGF